MFKTGLSLATLALAASTAFAAEATALPNKMECVVRDAYLRRADGAPGREVKLAFGDERLSGEYEAEIVVSGGALGGGARETVRVTPAKDGEVRLALPAGVGVDAPAAGVVTLRKGDAKISAPFVASKSRLWTVYLYPHAHVDIGYTNTQKNVEILHKNNILEGIKLGKETKDFPAGARSVWNPEVNWQVERLWRESDAAQRAEFVGAVKDGSICLDASYLNENTSTACDEEFFHFFEFGLKMRRETGAPVDVLQQMDVPGFTWGLVPVMSQLGVKYIMSWPNKDRGQKAHTGDIEGKPFWWVGRDGVSKVLFLQPGCYANADSMKKGELVRRPWFGQRDPSKVPLRIQTGSANVDFSTQCAAKEKPDFPYDFLVLSWSLWDNNPIDADIPAAVKAWNEKYVSPKIIISGGHDIMAMIEKKYGDKLPTVSGDFTEYWTDGLGSAAGLTAVNRATKERLVQVETLRSLMKPGVPASRAELDEAWRYAMLGSEHTWCSENPEVPYFQERIFRNKTRYFREADERSQDLIDEAIAPAADKSNGWFDPVGGASHGRVVVVNTLSFARGGVVTLSKIESLLGDRVTDVKGREVPSQRLSTGELLFVADPVPPLASAVYIVTKGSCSLADGCKAEGATKLGNGAVNVALDPVTGNIVNLALAGKRRNFADTKIDGGLNAFRYLAGHKPENAEKDAVESIELVENGPVVVEARVRSKAPGCRSVTRAVRLVRGQPWIECRDTVDKLPLLAKDGVHFGFAFDLPGSKTRVDIPWGVMEVEKDQWQQANRNWLAMQRWLDISNDDAGVTWCSPDAPVFECASLTAYMTGITFGKSNGVFIDRIPQHSNIYSWAMNNHWFTNFPLTQDGPVTFRYFLAPHEGGHDAAAANRFGLARSQPLVVTTGTANPLPKPAVLLDNDRVFITVLRTEEDGSRTLRLRSLSDKQAHVKLTFPVAAPKEIHYLSGGEPAAGVYGDTVTLPPFGCVSLRLNP